MRRLQFFYVVILYSGVSIIFTYPLAYNLNQYLMGDGGYDGYLYIWNIYTFWGNIINSKNPYFTDLIFYPIGANLVFNTSAPLVSLIGVFFLKFPVFYFNFLSMLSLVGAAMSFFALAYYLTRNKQVSFFGGLIYGFSPTLISFLSQQHYYLAYAGFVFPLELLLILKLFEGRARMFVYLCLLFWTVFFIDYYMTILYLIVGVVTVCILSLSTFDLKRVKIIFTKFWATVVLSIIFLGFLPGYLILKFLFRLSDFYNWSNNQSNYALFCNADLAGFITPTQNNIIFENLSKTIYSFFNFRPNGDTPYYYLGITFLILSLISIYKSWKISHIKIATGLVLIGILLAVGLQLRFGEIIIASHFKGLFYYLGKLPFLGLIDCPIRYSLIAHLGIGILVTCLLDKITKRYKDCKKIILVGVLFLFTLEFNYSGMTYTRVFEYNLFRQISLEEKMTILELPSGLTESKRSFGYDFSVAGLHSMQMYWQTIHQMPRFGGYISRIPDTIYHTFKRDPILADIFYMTDYKSNRRLGVYKKDEVKELFNKYKIGYVIIYPVERQDEYFKEINRLLVNAEIEYQIIYDANLIAINIGK